MEPAKNDVLFADNDFVIARLKGFLKSIYGELRTPEVASRPKPNSNPGGFDRLLARKPRPTDSTFWTADYRIRKAPSINHRAGAQIEEDRDNLAIDDNTVQRTEDSDEEKALRDVRISNPWTFAKINASVRHSDTLKKSELQRPNNQLLTPVRQAGEPTKDKRQPIQEQRQSHSTKTGLPSPLRTQADHSTPSLAQLSPAHNPFYSPQRALREKNEKDVPRKENTPQRGDGAASIFNSWVSINKPGNNFLIPAAAGLTNHEAITEDETQRPQTRGRDFMSAQTLPLDAPLGIPEVQADRIRGLMPRQRIGRNLNKSSFPPKHASRLVRNNASVCARSDSDSITNSCLSHSISSGNLGIVASNDDERRKQRTLQPIQRVKPMIEPRLATLQENSPPFYHNIPSTLNNRQTLQTPCLLDDASPTTPPNPSPNAIFEQGDPRAYLLYPFQQQHNNINETLSSSSAHHRPGRNRRKTSLLPLEAVREELTTRNLILVIPTAKLDINGLLAGLRSTMGISEEDGFLVDEYIAKGEFVGGFSSASENNDESSMQTHRYESKIRELLASAYGDEVGAEHEKLKFSSDLRASLAKC